MPAGLIRRLFGRTPDPIDDDTWSRVRARVRWIGALDAPREQRLRALGALFLRQKAITPIEPLALDDTQRTLLAALCCLPLLEFGEEGLHGWSQLIVYPDAFRVNRSHVDAAGVLHQWDDELIGEAMAHLELHAIQHFGLKKRKLPRPSKILGERPLPE